MLNLKPTDIDSKRGLLIIKQVDRVTPILNKVVEMMREYYKIYKPKTWLFEGQNSGKQFSKKSLQNIKSPFDYL